jgi:hypothetical protein
MINVVPAKHRRPDTPQEKMWREAMLYRIVRDAGAAGVDVRDLLRATGMRRDRVHPALQRLLRLKLLEAFACCPAGNHYDGQPSGWAGYQALDSRLMTRHRQERVRLLNDLRIIPRRSGMLRATLD